MHKYFFLTLFPLFVIPAWSQDSSELQTPGYEDWQDAEFTANQRENPEISGPDAVPEGDGVANALKYAMGLGYRDEMPGLIRIDEETGPRFSYQRDTTADISPTPQLSTDLQTWSPLPDTVVPSVEAGDGTLQNVSFTTPDGETTFMRLIPEVIETEPMGLGTNFWNFGWGSGRADYFENGIDWSTVDNPWRERFLEEIGIYSVIRWMDQVPTNSSDVSSWDERVHKTDNHYNTNRGAVAYEWQIDLCNRMGADIWITVPHLTIEDYEEDPEDNYWISLANLLKEQLDPNLDIYVEYSNETWSSGSSFRQGDYTGARGTQMGFHSQTYSAKFYFHVYAAMRLHKVFLDVFADQQERIKTVISGQGASTWGTEQLALAVQNRNSEGEDIPELNPWDLRPDYLAIANYISTGDGGASNIRQAWSDQLANSAEDYQTHREIVAPLGMRLISYEGGQHYTTNADVFSRNPESYDMYMEWLGVVEDYFDLTLNYTHVGTWASGGAWGAKYSTNQDISDAHRYRALRDWVVETHGE